MKYAEPETLINNNINTVVVKRCRSYDPEILSGVLDDIFMALSGFYRAIKDAGRILLKPNLLSPTDQSLAVTTHPLFIEAVIKTVRKIKGSNCVITIADSPGVSTPHTKKGLKNLYKTCGLLPLEKIEGVT